ncbi:unnamed protein product [Debaryomyces tyrocola]|nr:unnamed protein product [Debaryomyces tyrocola]
MTEKPVTYQSLVCVINLPMNIVGICFIHGINV